MKIIAMIISLLMLLSCQSVDKSPNAGPQNFALTKEYAQQRSKILKNVEYELLVNLDDRAANFWGRSKISFEMSEAISQLFLEFQKGKVERLKINQKDVSDITYNGSQILLPASYLVQGKNDVEVTYSHPYSRSGTGLHRYEDPADHQVYLYTQFEPFAANLFFPCFDQPDLKARMTLSVEAPKTWQVISTTRELFTMAPTSERKIWKFAQTAPLSTYLFSLFAGPYVQWNSTFENIPLRLFARRSFASYINSSFWFKITQQGLGFYNKYFRLPYPFKKYDQVVVPEFNGGAMENVGAVAFGEKFFPRGEPTEKQLEDSAIVILHEMAHMWFGDIVTMRWWDDLWLNETFATYMSFLAAAEATTFKTAWKSFFSKQKSWAYYEDQLVTTHPIEGQVRDTNDAMASFDGITYGKGASVMKQLSYLIGKDNFQKGVQAYLTKYAYSNAELKDFIASLQQFTKEDLSQWASVWLKEAGVDQVAVIPQCEKNRLQNLKITLSSATASWRPHMLEVALLHLKNKKLVTGKIIPVKLVGNITEVEVNEPCPDAIAANYNDHDYIKNQIDEKTLDKIKTSLVDIADPLTRKMFWSSLWQMVRDQQISLHEYAEIFRRHIEKESDLDILESVIPTVTGGRFNEFNSLAFYMPTTTEEQKSLYLNLITYIENLYWKKFQAAQANSNSKKFWFDNYVVIAQTPEAMTRLQKILSAKTPLIKLTIDQDRRWDMLGKMCRFSPASVQEILQQESQRDRSERGIQMFMACSSAIPDKTSKQEWLTKISDLQSPLSYSQQRVIMKNIFPPEQKSQRQEFAENFFSLIDLQYDKRDLQFLESFAERLAPSVCNANSFQRIKTFALQNKNLPYPVRRELLISAQEDERCWRIQELAAKTR